MSLSAALRAAERRLDASNGHRTQKADAYARKASQYAGRPADYAREVLNFEPTEKQVEIWEAANKPPYRVLVPSANAMGKTAAGAVAAAYNYDTHNPSKTLITATKKEQIKDGMFASLRTFRPGFGFAPKDTRCQDAPEHFIKGITSEHPDGFQGVHSPYLTLIFDEATGVAKIFWERAVTMFKGHEGHSWYCFYNPNDPSSHAYEEEESGNWAVVRLNALEHPNIIAQLKGLPPPIPSAVRLEQVRARIKAECVVVKEEEYDYTTDFIFPSEYSIVVGAPQYYRPETQNFEAQLLGRWPILPAGNLFTPAQVDKLYLPGQTIDPLWSLVIGCDVARFGNDKTAIVVRRGPVILHAETMAKRDSNDIAARILWLAYHHANGNVADAQNTTVVVDGTGGYGGAVSDRLKGQLRCIELSMAQKSPDPNILRMRSYLWFRMAQLAAANLIDLSRIDLHTFNEIRADLIAPKYRHSDGPKVIEPKSQIKSRIGRSPDLGDALGLCCYGVSS